MMRRAALWIGALAIAIVAWLLVWPPAGERDAPGPSPPDAPPADAGSTEDTGPGPVRVARRQEAPPATPARSDGPSAEPAPTGPGQPPSPPSVPADAPRLGRPPLPTAGGGHSPEPAAVDEPDRARELVFSPDKDGVQGAVREALPAIQECYEGWLEADPGLAGAIKVRFTVEADGEEARVTSASLLSSTMAHPFVEGCVLNAMSGLRFDPPEGGRLDVTYPLRFAPSEEAPP